MRMKVANMSSYHLDKIPCQWPPGGDFILHGACQEAFMLTCQSYHHRQGYRSSSNSAKSAIYMKLISLVDKASIKLYH